MTNEDSPKEVLEQIAVLEQVKDLVYFDNLDAARTLCKKHNITEKVFKNIRAEVAHINEYERHFNDFYNVNE